MLLIAVTSKSEKQTDLSSKKVMENQKISWQSMKSFMENSNCELKSAPLFQPLALFIRKGQDLVRSMELQLVEALCGFKKPVQTLDNRTLLITSHQGKTSSPKKEQDDV